jgi:hypothetical protein
MVPFCHCRLKACFIKMSPMGSEYPVETAPSAETTRNPASLVVPRRDRAHDFVLPTADVLPNAWGIIWLVMIAQNVLAQVVTGPLWGPRASRTEFSFSIFCVIRFCVTAAIILHYRWFCCPGCEPVGNTT